MLFSGLIRVAFGLSIPSSSSIDYLAPNIDCILYFRSIPLFPLI